MTRRAILAGVMTLAGAVMLPALPASAGGGCHDGVTTATGSTVTMAQACFTPTILKVDPGDTVTFVNKDAMAHNVTANRWGHFEDLNEAHRFEATFADPGVYPFACTYHPGMTGAIVVGDGTGAGNGEVISVPSLADPRAPTAEPVDTSPVSAAAATSRSSSVGWIVGGAIGLVIGAISALVLSRRRPAA